MAASLALGIDALHRPTRQVLHVDSPLWIDNWPFRCVVREFPGKVAGILRL